MENMKKFFYDVVNNLTNEEAFYYNELLIEIYLYHNNPNDFKEKILELQNKLIAEYIVK